MEIIGWIGSILLTFCVVPQVVKTYRTKLAGDFSFSSLTMWLFGEVFAFIYLFNDGYQSCHFQYPLLTNYFLNMFLATYMLYAKFNYGEK